MKNTSMVILCDLGGVLIDLNWIERARGLFGVGLDPEILKEKWLKLHSAREFEAGKTDFAGFYESFVAETGSTVALPDFKREFAGILGPMKPGCMDILARLRETAVLAMLSNTNLLHVQMIRESSPVFTPFDRLFLSYEMGMVKPDAQIFLAVCDQLGRQPDQILFFDDSAANIAAASACGIHSWRVDSPQEIMKIVDSCRTSGMI